MSLEISAYNEGSSHQPVMPAEVLQYLLGNKTTGLFIDGTAGGGGHTALMAGQLNGGSQLLAFDRDPEACERAAQRLTSWLQSGKVRIIHGSLDNPDLLDDEHYLGKVDGILLDLGLSSIQLNNSNRGFSFMTPGPLDMRMNQQQGATAADVLNQYDESDLARIFRDYGDEPRARKLANAIFRARENKPLTSTGEFAEIILRTLRPNSPAARMKLLARNYMALRMEVNQELELLTAELARAVKLLKSGGRLAVISFHSGEDRIVKNFIRNESRDCLCPPRIPRCMCDHQATLKAITKKPLRANDAEMRLNTRARSALLRVAEKL